MSAAKATSATDRRLTKGEETRSIILDVALNMASQSGFEALTIGSIAEKTQLSKSGVFAHFGSKEDLQIAVLDEAARRVSQTVFAPAMVRPRGLARLQAVLENWLGWADTCQLKGGCPIMAAAFEFDDRPGPVRDAVLAHHQRMQNEIARACAHCVETGEFRPDVDARQFAFEVLGIANAFYFAHRLFREADARERAFRAFSRLAESCRAAQTSSSPAAAGSSQPLPSANR